MIEQNDDRSLLAHYAAILWRRKWYLVGGVLIAVVVAVVTVKGEAERWSASSQVFIASDGSSDLLGGGGSGLAADAAERNASNAATIATSDTVVADGLRVARLDLDPSDVDLSVTPQTGTDVLQFTVKDADPARAAKLAKAMAKGYVGYVAAARRKTLREAQENVQQRLDRLGNGDADAALRQALVQRETQIETALDLPSDGPSVLATDVSAAKVQPRPKRALLLGIVLGLLAGLAAAGVREALDTRVRGASDVGAVLKLAPLGTVAPRRGRSPASTESLQGVRTSILGRLGPERPVALTVTASEGRGGVDMAGELAESLARSGESTILVRLESDAGGDELHGLVRVIDDLPNIDTYLSVPNGTPSLRVLWGSAAQGQNGEELFAPRRLEALVAELKVRADVVIVGTPSLLERHEGAAFAAATDAVVVVVDSDAVPRSRLRRLGHAIAGLPGQVLGFVAVGRRG